jgi:serine protease Do
MNKFKLITSMLLLGSISTAVIAQTTTKTTKEEIVILKKSAANEKMTIVIDGDKVTVNGKPVEDFKSDVVEIKKRKGPVRVTAPRMAKGFRIFEDDDNVIFNGGNKAMLGVYTEKVADGAKITTVSDNSAAEKAGLKKDDIITKVGDKAIDSPETLADVIGDKKVDDKVEITYKRDGKEAKTTATLQKGSGYSFNFNGDDIMKEFNIEVPTPPSIAGYSWGRKPKLGLQIEDVEEGKGVKVKDVEDNTPAAKAGLKADDIITAVNDKAVNSVDELKQETATAKEGDTLQIKYTRNGKNQTADLKIPKKIKTATL